MPSTQPDLGQVGRYRLLSLLGRGGMGEVYLAHDTRLDRRVALKLLPPHSVGDPAAVARFRREALALARLSHPAIVQVHDADEDAGRHFLVMEHVEGDSLAAALRQYGALPPAWAAECARQAALGLQHAHERGLVHRDVKPSNLLVTAEGQVKVLDLGLARFLQDQLGDPARTREGACLGTPDYAAPEQFRNARGVDERADQYGLGCTLYHLLTGRPPFPGSSLAEKERAHEEDDAPALEGLCPGVPPGLTAVVQRLMAKRPEDRFPSMRAAAEALAPFAAAVEFRTRGETVELAPCREPTAAFTPARPRARRRVLVAA
jgi:serine/threonine-protein kinase